MSTPAHTDECARFVRHQRVHFETEREHVDGVSDPGAAGFVLRLFALHEKGMHVVPGCPACARLALELRRVAEMVVRDESVDADAEMRPFAPVLYDSRLLPGRDEVAIAVHLRPRRSVGQRREADDQCIRRIGRILKRIGVEGA